MASVARQALSAGLATLITRSSGLAREIVFAAVFGATMQTDAYLAALRVPNLFRDLFAEGSMSNAFVPNFAKESEEDGLESAFALANALLGLALLALGVLTALMVVFSESWVWVVAAGFFEVPGKTELTGSLVRVVAPFLAMVSVASIFGGMLNVRGRFFLPALAPASFNLAVIAGCMIPASWQEPLGIEPIWTVALASTVGGLLQAAVQYPTLRRLGFRLRPSLRGHPGLKRLLVFLGPALMGVATIQAGVLVDVQIASTLGDGPVSWLGYAFRLVQLPMSVFAGSVAVAGLATLSAQVARGERQEARATLGDAVSLTSFLVLPSAVALGVFAEPLVALFYQRGAFSAADTAATASLLQLYALGTYAFCMHRVVTPSFYAWGDPWSPMALSVLTVISKIPLALWLSREQVLGVEGIPLAHALVASAEVAVLAWLLGRRSGGWASGVLSQHLRMLGAGVLMGGVGWWLLGLVDGLLLSMVALALSGGVYLGAAWLLGLPQPRKLLARLRPPPPPPEASA